MFSPDWNIEAHLILGVYVRFPMICVNMFTKNEANKEYTKLF